jgi:hypothetical protein
MIVAAKATNIQSGFELALSDDNLPFLHFVTRAEIRSETNHRTREHGAYPSNTLVGTRTYDVEGDLFGLDSEDFVTRWLDLNKLLMPSYPIVRGPLHTLDIEWAGMTERLLADVTLQSYEMPLDALSPSRARWQILWKAFDPRMYGSTLKTSTTGGTVSVTNAGNVDSPPKITLNSGTNPAVVLDGDYSLEYVGTIGTAVILDFEKKTAKTASGVDHYDKIRGTWWKIPAGGHSIEVENGNATIRFRNAYSL